MKFSKPGFSFSHTTNSFKRNWYLALHDPLFLFIMGVIIGIVATDLYLRYFQ